MAQQTGWVEDLPTATRLQRPAGTRVALVPLLALGWTQRAMTERREGWTASMVHGCVSWDRASLR
ncbi:MAG: hypothetical protein AAGG72_02195 [Pseudomonadota bacterium]